MTDHYSPHDWPHGRPHDCPHDLPHDRIRDWSYYWPHYRPHDLPPWTTQNQGKISFEDFGHLATLVEAIGLATVWNNVGRQILATFQLPAFSINLGGILLPPGWKPPLFPILYLLDILELLVLNALVLNWENRNRFWWIYTLFVDTQFTEWQNVLYGQNKEVRCCVF